jgi:hypothetical protein
MCVCVFGGGGWTVVRVGKPLVAGWWPVDRGAFCLAITGTMSVLDSPHPTPPQSAPRSTSPLRAASTGFPPVAASAAAPLPELDDGGVDGVVLTSLLGFGRSLLYMPVDPVQVRWLGR